MIQPSVQGHEDGGRESEFRRYDLENVMPGLSNGVLEVINCLSWRRAEKDIGDCFSGDIDRYPG